MTDYYSVSQVAHLWGVTGQYVRDLILSRRLLAVKVGRTWRIPAAAVAVFKRRPKGRPKGTKNRGR